MKFVRSLLIHIMFFLVDMRHEEIIILRVFKDRQNWKILLGESKQ